MGATTFVFNMLKTTKIKASSSLFSSEVITVSDRTHQTQQDNEQDKTGIMPHNEHPHKDKTTPLILASIFNLS